MAFDFRKEYKEFYLPKTEPGIVSVPPMNFLAAAGSGDPNEEGGDYQQMLELLYGLAYTLKMSYKTPYRIEGFFDYVVPPLEGFWRQAGTAGIDKAHKERFEFLSVIRLPDFIREEDFRWAVEEATRKKKKDFSRVSFRRIDEGLCVQCLHLGSYDDEPATIARMTRYAQERGFEPDFSDTRLHHEIYLSDPRRCAPEKLKTVIRHPIRKKA
jgi:hypothetical protein